ncbi:hypothetical protein GPALN_003343 [Globodera pallida]|nr:hypothetical protein GPALN_003343 [Globodera pallida]
MSGATPVALLRKKAAIRDAEHNFHGSSKRFEEMNLARGPGPPDNPSEDNPSVPNQSEDNPSVKDNPSVDNPSEDNPVHYCCVANLVSEEVNLLDACLKGACPHLNFFMLSLTRVVD